jgi:Holliday junction resolvasome RuvABC endonuclease subunit
MKYLGIDPGNSGGMAIIDEDGTIDLLDLSKTTEHDVVTWIARHKFTGPITATVEMVGSMPGQGVASTFKFGRSYGFVLGVITALSIPYVKKTPQTWQRAVGVTKRGKNESKTLYKNRLKSLAQQLFAGQKGITLKTCDALLIAEYTRRQA